MISRTTMFLDRLAALVLALLLIGGGLLGVWWWTGDSALRATTDTTSITRVLDEPWWPWASGAVGVFLVLLGLRWIAAHVRGTKVKHLHLPGSGADGRLEVDCTPVADAAATAFADTLGVRNATGTVRRNRGQIVAILHATIEPEADLALIAESADLISSHLAHALGRDDLRASIELRVARRGNRLPRVNQGTTSYHQLQ